MKRIALFSFGILLLNSVLAEELDCDPNKVPNLLEKIAVPNPEFRQRAYITPDEFQKYTSRELAEKLVQRMHRECDEERGAKEGVPLETDSDIMMFVPSGALEAIEQYGFQNQHVTRTTSGSNTRDGRYSAEIEFPGMILGYSPKSKDLLPKYAALNVRREENSKNSSPPYQYGDVVFVFKDEVKKRTSWTPADSLGYMGLNLSRITSSLKYKEDSERKFTCQFYCEAQIWGDIGFSDVAYAIIKPGTLVPEQLKRNGIPVFYSKDSTSSVKLEKGEVAYAGDKKLQDRPQDPDLTKGENKVTNRVIDQKLIPTLKFSELNALIKNSFDVETKRVLLGQIALEKSPEVKKFLLENLSTFEDPISRSQILLGLSRYGDDPKVRGLFKTFLESQIPEKMDLGMIAYSMMSQSSVEILTAMAIIADTDGFKDDKELKNVLDKVVKSNATLSNWYERLFNKLSLCPRPNNESQDFAKSSYSGFGGMYGGYLGGAVIPTGGYAGGFGGGTASGASGTSCTLTPTGTYECKSISDPETSPKEETPSK